jgi:hypothetical protein
MTNELVSFLVCQLCEGSSKSVGLSQTECLSFKAAYPVEDAIHEHSKS